MADLDAALPAHDLCALRCVLPPLPCCLTQLMWATISIVGLLFMQPTDPGKANPRTVVQLQQFSWTEGALEDCIKVQSPHTASSLLRLDVPTVQTRLAAVT